MQIKSENQRYRELLNVAIADLTIGADKIIGDAIGIGEIEITIKLVPNNLSEMYIRKYSPVGMISSIIKES